VTPPRFRRSKCDGRHNAFSALQRIDSMDVADRRGEYFAGSRREAWIVLDFMPSSQGFSRFFLGRAVQDK
jgi:hypothetical protein